MITVEVLSSNLEFFNHYELEERLTYSEFQKISENMQDQEYIEFALYNAENEPFYKGKFTKEGQLTVTDDIFSVLKKYKKQKKISGRDRKEIEEKIKASLSESDLSEPPIKKPRKQIQIPKMPKWTIPIKKIGIVFLFTCLFIGGGFAVKSVLSDQKDKQPSLQEYLTKKNFKEAAEAYPDKISEVENELFLIVQKEGRTHLKDLSSFQKKYPTEQGTFDLAMFDYQYDVGISTFEKNKQLFKHDETRQILVGYAYLKEGQVKKAEEIQHTLNSPELEKFIRQYKQYQLIIDEKEKEIATLQKKPSENKQKIEKAIDDLYEAKQSLSEL
ncbi:hypothetical protein A5819_003615 [Enterococcus sp. 7E2_DIV0204]|uniref:hypothetical protein n=1 Tax=unclassified Enterococcus TaxID=2608891 RepID=UPI000A34E9DC|nr:MULTISPECIES: hypothetical protein [unclassified Enterococcus]OTN84065.1 hypothetical protein A5819_003615 [Enterococcus sp. 7E2_DIV0204]OTP47247.1 hypothetical protein A5884_003622 [Enterococcus sp. 7D2_DIV0200]